MRRKVALSLLEVQQGLNDERMLHCQAPACQHFCLLSQDKYAGYACHWEEPFLICVTKQ